MTTSEKKIAELYELIEGIEVAMLTTRRPDGSLVSRAMATQERTKDADLIFVTSNETHKLDELQYDSHVNVSYYNNKSREWVSVSGTARISRNRGLIEKLYKPDWKIWFGDKGGDRDGGPGDPRLTLLLVDAQSVTYLKVDKPKPVILFELAKGLITGSQPEMGETRHISGGELMD